MKPWGHTQRSQFKQSSFVPCPHGCGTLSFFGKIDQRNSAPVRCAARPVYDPCRYDGVNHANTRTSTPFSILQDLRGLTRSGNNDPTLSSPIPLRLLPLCHQGIQPVSRRLPHGAICRSIDPIEMLEGLNGMKSIEAEVAKTALSGGLCLLTIHKPDSVISKTPQECGVFESSVCVARLALFLLV